VNFVLICIDTLRYDHLSCNGGEQFVTPNLEAFARESLVFDNAYAGSLMTVPMRTDIIRGRFGQPFHPWWPLGFDRPTLPRALAGSGWATMLVCDTPHLINGAHGFDWPFHAWHFERGSEVDRHIIDTAGPGVRLRHWDDYSDQQKRTIAGYLRNNRHRRTEDDWQGPRTLQFAGDFVEANRDRDGFFLWVDTFELHEPWLPPEDYVALYDDAEFDADGLLVGLEPLEKLDEAELRHVRAHYAAEVTMLDRHVGRFLDRLAGAGLDGRTTVMVTSDHGVNLGERGVLGKGAPWHEQVAHEVLMVRGPGVKCGRTAAIVQPADLMPTVLELAGLDAHETCQGRSLVPELGGGRGPARKVAVTGSAVPADGVAVQDERWCLIDYIAADKRALYDKHTDRSQQHNVIGEHPAEAGRLHAELLDWLREHDAPPKLVEGFGEGTPVEASEVFPRPEFLRNFRPYWNFMLPDDA
jgi:arylsulfatase A-like enzyme